MSALFEKMIMASWYGPWQWTRIFWPVMWLFAFISNKKRTDFLANKQQAKPYSVPVVVVGNITVGGTGKTPVVQSLVAQLNGMGLKVGIISRGYGGTCDDYPHLLTQHDSAEQVGDEPLMLFQSLNIPVVVDPDRHQALQRILECNVDVVISDDGMQHYKLDRQMEICVLDGKRGLGNGLLLPVGPLRESPQRLNAVDFVLHNQGETLQALPSDAMPTESAFTIEPVAWMNVVTGERLALNDLTVKPDAKAIAGIGNPQKFFDSLRQINISVEEIPYADHYGFSASDMSDLQGQVLMTQKDAVKLAPLANHVNHDDMWYLHINAQLNTEFMTQFKTQLKTLMESSHG